MQNGIQFSSMVDDFFVKMIFFVNPFYLLKTI
jgi:hypothetical protein